VAAGEYASVPDTRLLSPLDPFSLFWPSGPYSLGNLPWTPFCAFFFFQVLKKSLPSRDLVQMDRPSISLSRGPGFLLKFHISPLTHGESWTPLLSEKPLDRLERQLYRHFRGHSTPVDEMKDAPFSRYWNPFSRSGSLTKDIRLLAHCCSRPEMLGALLVNSPPPLKEGASPAFVCLFA